MLKVLSLFSGIGAFEKALSNLGVDYELVNYCEIDRFASKSYAAVHNVSEDLNLWDVRKIIGEVRSKEVNLITYSFPCQDISIAGRQRGLIFNNEKTRSGLFFDACNVIRELQPEYAIAENVKALTSKKFTNEFELIRECLDSAGYNNYYAVLNAKDYSIPQNRERVFIVSIRKDIDKGTFTFPQKIKLTKCLRDMLEDEVDDSFFIRTEQSRQLIQDIMQREKMNVEGCDLTNRENSDELSDVQKDCVEFDLLNEPKILKYERTEYAKKVRKDYENGVLQERRCNLRQWTVRKDHLCNTLTTVQKDNMVLVPKVCQIGNIIKQDKGWSNPQVGRVYDPMGLSPTLNTMQGGGREPKIIIKGSVGKCGQRSRVYDPDGICSCLTATDYKDPVRVIVDYEIRKLTPLECWRLMGFTDEDFYKAKNAGISNTQLYKQAGNSIVVTVLESLFKNLLELQEVKDNG